MASSREVCGGGAVAALFIVNGVAFAGAAVEGFSGVRVVGTVAAVLA